MARVGLRFPFCLCIMLMMVCSASVVLELGLKAYWVGEMMSCVVRWVMIWSLSMVSKILAMIGRREIGR